MKLVLFGFKAGSWIFQAGLPGSLVSFSFVGLLRGNEDALKSKICPFFSIFINVCLVTGGYVTDVFWFSGINRGISNVTPKRSASFSFLGFL